MAKKKSSKKKTEYAEEPEIKPILKRKPYIETLDKGKALIQALGLTGGEIEKKT